MSWTEAGVKSEPLRQLKESPLGGVRSRQHTQAETRLRHAAVSSLEDLVRVLMKGEFIEDNVPSVTPCGVGIGGEDNNAGAVPEADLVLAPLSELELPVLGQVSSNAFVGINQPLGLARQLERLPLGPGQEDHGVLRPLQAPLEHRPRRRGRRVADLRGLDRQGQPAIVLRPPDLERPEDRLRGQFPFVRLDLDRRAPAIL
jgi:hypothetical protein